MQITRTAPLFTRILVRKGCVTIHLEGLQVIVKKQNALIYSLPGSSSLQQAKAPLPEDLAVKDLVSRLRIGAFDEGWAANYGHLHVCQNILHSEFGPLQSYILHLFRNKNEVNRLLTAWPGAIATPTFLPSSSNPDNTKLFGPAAHWYMAKFM